MDQDKTLPFQPQDEDSGGAFPRHSQVNEKDVIGPYRLLEMIGEGGMGEVWLAEQTEPIKRRVALKILKQGMDSKRILTRFEAESQALALMDHPYVAKVFDAGATPDGRPYIAMEYVKGTPITDHCDQHKLDIHERLQLIQQVCEGVQHAHQKAIIHRDLKPGNILVFEQDGKRMPKIIDFGVAKATSQKLTENTMYTQMGALVGTPEYMSPEQADLSGDDVDTRTDVYSIGVVLYRLLVGSLPFDREKLWKAGFEGIRQVIREEEPPKPSTRFSTLGDESTEAAHARRTEPPALRRSLKGDLDWITMMAMEKDRARRYASPLDLARDIERYLGDEPVLACPPSAGYRARKFARRHRVGVLVTMATAILLAGFAVTSTIQARSIARARDRAEAEAAKAEAMNEFLASMLTSADPWSGGAGDVTVVEALDAAVQQVETAFVGQPRVEASMHVALGRTYLGLGKLEPATEQIETALKMYEELDDSDPRELGELRMIETKLRQDTNDFDAAVNSAAEAVRLYGQVDDVHAADLMEAYQIQTRNLMFALRYAEAESVLVLSEELAPKVQGPRRILAAENYSLRGDLLDARDANPAAADSLSRLAYEFARSIEPGNPMVAVYLNNAAQYRSETGDLEGALLDFDEALILYAEAYGTDHPQYATGLENRGGVLYRLGRPEETLAALKEVREIRERNLGPDHIDVVRTSLNVGTVAMITGKDEEALAVFKELEPVLIEARGFYHPDVLVLLRNEGNALRHLERYEEATVEYERSLAISIELNGDDHPLTARGQFDLSGALYHLDRLEEAEALVIPAFDITLAASGPDHPATQSSASLIVKIYEKMGQPEKADPYRKYIE